MGVPNQHEMPFFESAEDASYSAIISSRKPPKEIALTLWPSMKSDSAYARLMGALKHTRPEKLTADEHILIANHTGHYDFFYYVQNQCHHAGAQPVTPEDEDKAFRRELNDNITKVLQALSRVDRKKLMQE